jgi:hypothetical protein
VETVMEGVSPQQNPILGTVFLFRRESGVVEILL